MGQEGWQRILDHWGVRAVLVSREQQKDLLPLIARDPGWRVLYRDRFGALFVRR